MSNVVAFRPGRSGRLAVTPDAAGRILFFTGVRYVRDEMAGERFEPSVPPQAASSDPEAMAARLKA